METSLEILKDETDSFESSSRLRDDVLSAMNIYATLVARKALEVAANNVRLIEVCKDKTCSGCLMGCCSLGTEIDMLSILNTEIKTP